MASGWGGVGAWGPATPLESEDVEQQQAPPQSNQAGYQPSAYQPPAPVQAPVAEAPRGFFGKSFGASSNQGAWGGASASGAPGTDLESREAALKRKEAELAAREKKVAEAEAQLKASGVTLKKNNWPICYPLTHHDISGEIPQEKKRVVREAYVAWWGLSFCLCYNLLCASVMLGYDADQKVGSWFLAVIYWLTGIPLSFIFWYRKIYLSARDESTIGFLFFFLWFCVHIGFCVWAAIAIPFSTERWSFAGFVTAMSALDVDTAPGIIYLIGAAFWSIEAVYSFWVLKDIWFFFRGKGGVQQVQQEAALAAFKAGVANNNQGTRV